MKIAAILNLEETTLIDILLNKKVQTNPKNKNTTTPRSFGLSKKCDIGVQIKRNQHNQHPGVSLKDYFYLNQVKVKVVNEHPE
ncbi:MAG: hypothetical protein PHP14_03640 [Candidatus Pacebacteria bacterium]|nr:hypothetical protein [Candidatus Paceibacterota bacterium]MDD3808496.1 hypothetical protein [Candidatus Paceibacterota bacterium]